MIGKIILNYRIESLIGKGGMGMVYLATNINIDQKVAIKVLNAELAGNENIRKRFKQEATTLAKLDHSSIVRFLNYVEEDGNIYLIMEYVVGMTLDAHIENVSGPIHEKQALKYFKQLLDAFKYAHTQGIVHRDIKPSNIIVTNSGQIKVLDFGIAKIINDSGMTEVGMKIGTAMYMSPEQVRGQEVDKRSDIYSLGVLLHQMVSGVAPYDSTTLSEFDINVKVVEEPLPRAKEFYPFVSDKIQKIIDKAVSKKADDRYKDCSHFKAALVNAVYPKTKFNRLISPKQRKAIIGIAALLLILIGFGVWDYTRTKVAYYKDYAENMGVPQGLGKLSKREMKAREFSYRFESKGYKVRRVTRVNSVDKLFELSSGNMEWLRPNDFQLYYLDNGKVDYVEVLDRNHNVLCKKDYNDKLNVVTLRHNDELGTEMCISTNVENDPFSTNSDEKSSISRYLISYDDDGFIETIRFARFQNVPTGTPEGLYGYDYLRDRDGRILQKSTVGIDGKLKANSNGESITRYTYDDAGNCISKSSWGNNNQPSMDSDKIHSIKYEYDKWGNDVLRTFFNADGKPALDYNSIGGVIFTYDKNGFNIRTQYIDDKGKNVYSAEGISLIEYIYDSNGRIISFSYMDENGKPATSSNGFHKLTKLYDENGNTLEWWYYDEEGSLTYKDNSYAGTIYQYDERGNAIKGVAYDINKNPIPIKVHEVGYIWTYDELNRKILTTNIDKDMKPTPDINGTVHFKQTYDIKGNVIALSRYDKDMKLVSGQPYAGWNKKYDESGNLISFIYFDKDSLPCPNENGITRYDYEYDASGNQIKCSYFDKNGKPYAYDGVVASISEYDGRNNLVKTVYLNAQGKPSTKHFISQRIYDDFDNEIDYLIFDHNSKPILGDAKFHRRVAIYDDLGRAIEYRFYGTDNKLKKGSDGYAVSKMKYNTQGNVTEEEYYDEKEKPCLKSNKLHRSVWAYDNYGYLSHEVHYGIDGKPIKSTSDFVSELTRINDSRGNCLELQIKDGNGNIVDGKSGWAIRKRTYDAKKNCLTETYYNAKNQLAEDEDKVAKYEYVYDEKDNMIEVKSYNKQGKPFSPVFKAVYKYDEKNNCIEIICLDKDNAPAQNSFGTYRINYEYDKAGELAKCKYYNKAGTLIAVTDAEGNRLDKSATASEIRDYAESISESCPAVIVDGLIFANAFHASGNEMQLIWKLDGMRKSDISEAEINELRTAIRQIALENGVVQNCREFKVRVVINVFDDNMDEIFKVTV